MIKGWMNESGFSLTASSTVSALHVQYSCLTTGSVCYSIKLVLFKHLQVNDVTAYRILVNSLSCVYIKSILQMEICHPVCFCA